MTHGSATDAADNKMMMKKGARAGTAAGSGSSTMSRSSDADSTRQLNEQELGRVRSGAGG
jgi:hypothetical protein